MKYPEHIEKEVRNVMILLGYEFDIKEFEEKAKWWDVSSIPDLSEEFIEFYDSYPVGKISWLAISKHRNAPFTESFYEKHKHKLRKCDRKRIKELGYNLFD